MTRLLTAAIRHVEPVLEAPTGSVLADVYADLDAHVGRLPPFLIHSPDEETIRAVWVFGREAWLAGPMPRLQREAIAAAVSARNTCPFCLEAHTMSLVAADRVDVVGTALGDDPVSAISAWASAPASRSAAPPSPVPAEHAGPAIGTIVAFEYMNRVVNVLAADTLLAGVPKAMRNVMRKAGSKKMGASILAVQPDHSSNLVAVESAATAARDGALSWIDGWESTWPQIAASVVDIERVVWGGLVAELGPRGVARLEQVLEEWDGGLSSSNVVLRAADDLSSAERLVIDVAVHSYADTDPLVAEVRRLGADDRSLVRLVAGGAWLAAERIGRWRSV